MHRTYIFSCIIILTIIGCFTFLTQTHAVSLSEGDIITSSIHPSVYKYENGVRRPFPNSNVYYTWYSSFENLKTISASELETISLGNPMPVKENTKLIKFPFNPKIYAVTAYAHLQYIPDPNTAIALFGVNWEDTIIELPEIYSLFYTQGEALEKQTSEITIAANCNIFPDKLNTCSKYKCKFIHPLTGESMYKEIKGLINNTCNYIEEMPNSGQMECNYTENDRKTAAQYYKDVATSESNEVEFNLNLGTGEQKTTYKIDGEIVENPLMTFLDNKTCIISGY